MRSRRNVILGVVLCLLLIIFLMFRYLHHQPRKVNLYRATPGGSNIQFPYLAASHTIDFFTGSAFAEYDTKHQTTKTISPQFILPTVTQVRWSKTGVLFQASDYTRADDLYPALNDKGLPANKEYWWLYSFATKKLNVVVPKNAYFNTVDALWNASGDNYCYISTDGSLYLSGSDRPIAKAGIDARIQQFNNATITLTEGTNLERVNAVTGDTQILARAGFQKSYVSPDGQTIAYILNTHPRSNGVVPGDVYLINPDSLKPKKVLSDIYGAMAGDGGDLYVGYTDADGNNHLRLFPKAGRSVDYSLGASLNRGDTVGAVLPVSPRTLYIISATNNLVEVTNEEKPVSTPVSYRYKIQTDLYLAGYEIHYDPYKDTYEIDISANPFPAHQAAALAYIRAQKVDPNQIQITWRAFNGVNQNNPAVDHSPIRVGDFKD